MLPCRRLAEGSKQSITGRRLAEVTCLLSLRLGWIFNLYLVTVAHNNDKKQHVHYIVVLIPGGLIVSPQTAGMCNKRASLFFALVL